MSGSSWFILFVSIWSVLHSMFPNDDKLVCSLFIALLKFPRFIFCSCDSVSLGLIGCTLFCSVASSFSEVSSSFRLFLFGDTWFVWYCIILFICFLMDFYYSITRSENKPFFIIALIRSASLWHVVWKLAHLARSLSFFSYIRFVKGCSIVQVDYLPLSMFPFRSQFLVVPYVVIHVPEKKSGQHSQDEACSSSVGYQERTCRSWYPRLWPASHVV